MELTTEEKARIFAMYWDSDVRIDTSTKWTSSHKDVVMLGVDQGDVIYREKNNYVSADTWPIYASKLLLRPLSKVTDEDAIEVAKLKDIALEQYEHAVHRGDSKFIQFISVTFRTGRRESEEEIIDFNGEGLNNEQAQFLISKGYAVRIWPHYKTPIELGLAIERED